MSPNQNNANVYVYVDGNKYPISYIKNLFDFCMVFDSNSYHHEELNPTTIRLLEQSEMDSLNDHNLLIDTTSVKLNNLAIITSAIKSHLTFIGLDMSLFSEFTEQEKRNVINWIDKNRSSSQCVLIILKDIIFSKEFINANFYMIDDGSLKPLK
jgi:hypothetical protein